MAGKADGQDTYRAAVLAAWLTAHEDIADGPARLAGQRIARAWNHREFYASPTGLALAACLRASGRGRGLGREVDRVADRLARRFGVHLHDVAAWDPRPHWRKEIR
ncbi:hypothetical protein [Amycolatopsis suaedae]|uniref:Uncharacterized protein n=1 Tax=Amycolatopsis suaedae TaxID=2510978 RepID=A0A4Q7J0J9_9PSEU|nr:hypothetical protein [Amycolatopsis suaedae]RZQ60870.1 hypothetical protein EWH70_27620 [Amycolatopsis suaedae]